MKQHTLRCAAPLAASLTFLTACSVEAPEAQETGEVAPAEWTVLFNGRNLDGWRTFGQAEPNPAWIVEDGAIVLNVDADTEDTTGGDLITGEQYENFELELEWRISTGGNSGIFYRVREIEGQDVAYETGVEMQVLDDERHVDGQNPATSAGACYALYPPAASVVRPVGEYNHARLVVKDGRAEHWLNGEKIVTYEIGSGDWNERVANSKFASWEHFAKYSKGHIGLQDHTDRVWFRNIRIREL